MKGEHGERLVHVVHCWKPILHFADVGTTCSQFSYTVCWWVPIWIPRLEYKLNIWVFKIVEQYLAAIISRHTSSISNEDVAFPICSTVIVGASMIVVGTLKLAVGTPRHLVDTPRLMVGAAIVVAGAYRSLQICCPLSQVLHGWSPDLFWPSRSVAHAPRCT